ncbi:MAG: class II fumarate hydratase [Bacteroidetes bacterium]|nr:class II fumarate hydratase [Bacteroidota bacterium]
MSFRTESDSMGDIQVENSRYWGAQTQRSLQNFKIGTTTFHPEFIYSLVMVKKACAIVNFKIGKLEKPVYDAVIQACDEIIAGKFNEHFPLKIYQTGSGTQTNMNANEVIANRANEILGAPLGAKKPVHANDTVNKSQSSNDVFPTAMHVAVARFTESHLIPRLESLIRVFEKKQAEFDSIIKIGRTHLQDATPVTLGQEFSGYVAQMKVALAQINQAKDSLLDLAIGGTAVGTGLNAPKNFDKMVSDELTTLTGLKFRPNPNKFQGLAGHEQLAYFHGALKALATGLMKIANDIRWLASGPRAGIGELLIPENEPGSSIMPGKVNPTQSEAMTMVCVQVFGNDAAVGFASSQGNFELNVFKPVILHNVMESLQLLGDACDSFEHNCAYGIEPNVDKLRENMEKSLMLVTALNPHIGYDNAAKIAKKAHHEGTTLKEAALSLGLLTDAQYNEWVDPKKMI